MTTILWITVAVISLHLTLDFFNVGRELAAEWGRGT